MTAALSGFGIGLTLILAIGSQNAFVLRQGLRGEHVAPVCLTCAISDAILIALGVGGFQAVVARAEWIEPVFLTLGAGFLILYGARSLWSAATSTSALTPGDSAPSNLFKTLGICLALTWLNPHVYLDTVIFLGAVSTGYPGEETAFALGAAAASFTFFFSLGYGARILRPVFASARAWRILDLLVGLLMWTIAARLVFGATL
ncbi:LysE/ArgO family amino acid transporter [Roseivivax sp. THAF30]|uniref:LysE/ArgO family amino acid transporter n=1 Tax=Roseivivax sp. THAF30 TaxID=2587852 RepID=UPI001268F804|nr:LysE/ArgO family amino acid transporter [Roseivivax sp. THAF30]QFT61793.1 Arginine exporter protein ArgO [Roseivivax sp. THAF30]